MQFIILAYAQSKEILPLPWMQSTAIVDSNENALYLGKITLFSLVFTLIGLVKAASESFEIQSTQKQIMAAIYAMVNLYFRLMSMVYVIIYLGIFSVPLFVILVLVNYIILMYNDERKRKWASTISSLVVSIFLPIWISRYPENFQIKEEESMENEQESQEKAKEEATAKKLVSFRLAIFSNPIIFGMDIVVFLCLTKTEFVQDTVWSNTQLEEFFILLLCPMFLLTMLGSVTFSNLLEENSSTDESYDCLFYKRLGTTFWKRSKKYLSGLILLGMIVIGVVFSILVDKINRTSLAFVSNQNELVVIQVISKGPLTGCEGEGVQKCHNLTFDDSDFRNTSMVDGVAYVQRPPKVNLDLSQLNERKTPFFDLTSIQIWKKDGPEQLKHSKPHCKRCLVYSLTCNQILNSIQDVDRCDGK